MEPPAGIRRAGVGGAVHGLDHEIEGGVGAVGAFVVVAGFGEFAGGEGEDADDALLGHVAEFVAFRRA